MELGAGIENETLQNLIRDVYKRQCHGSSVGRTPDWRSGCRWFKSGPRHILNNITISNIKKNNLIKSIV